MADCLSEAINLVVAKASGEERDITADEKTEIFKMIRSIVDLLNPDKDPVGIIQRLCPYLRGSNEISELNNRTIFGWFNLDLTFVGPLCNPDENPVGIKKTLFLSL
jgi:hypothetical protein